MSERPAKSIRHNEAAYAVSIAGHLDARWASTLGISSLTHEIGGTTTLRTAELDQPALHGLLQRLRDLSLPLISVVRIERDQPNL